MNRIYRANLGVFLLPQALRGPFSPANLGTRAATEPGGSTPRFACSPAAFGGLLWGDDRP